MCALCVGPKAGLAAKDRVGFVNVTRRRAREAVDFKLPKIETYNRTARQQRRPIIRYDAYHLKQPGSTQSLDFVFRGLSEEQFWDVRKLYGDVGRSKAKGRRSDYHLLDFMSPLIQALDGHVFKYVVMDVPQINAGRTGAYGTPNAPVEKSVSTNTNCWSTLYALLRDLRDGATTPRKEYSLFFTGRFQADEVLTRLSSPVAKVKVRQSDPIVLPPGTRVDFGDLLLIKKSRRQLRDVEMSARGTILSSKPGKMVKVLEHAGFFVDENLIFEKPDGGSDLPFRFVSLEDAVAPHRAPSQLEVLIRRRNGVAMLHPREAFGGNAHAVDERYAKPLSGPLKKVLLLGKELDLPLEGVYDNSWHQLVDLDIVLDSRTQRFSLAPSASCGNTYKQQLLPPAKTRRR